MFTHEPPDYTCPYCTLLAGHEDEFNRKEDIVYQNDFAMAYIAPKWWIHNPGHVLVIPTQHYENLYDIPDHALTEVYKLAKKVAIAIRETYDGCQGTSTRQHNEPAGGQSVWHLHVHVFPRYDDDNLYEDSGEHAYVHHSRRLPYARKLQAYFAKHKP